MHNIFFKVMFIPALFKILLKNVLYLIILFFNQKTAFHINETSKFFVKYILSRDVTVLLLLLIIIFLAIRVH